MQAQAGALPLADECVREPRWREAVGQDRHELREVDKREIEPDAYRPCRTSCEVPHTAPAPYEPIGLVVVASAWLAFYIIAAVRDLIASIY